MKFMYCDGGRSKYFQDVVGDCVTRAFAIGLDADYLSVYELVNNISKNKSIQMKTKEKGSSARTGVFPKTIGMIGKHFNLKYRLKKGIVKNIRSKSYILCLNGHLTCIKNGILMDTHDCSEQEYYAYYEL
jgi:hypothetical protein